MVRDPLIQNRAKYSIGRVQEYLETIHRKVIAAINLHLKVIEKEEAY